VARLPSSAALERRWPIVLGALVVVQWAVVAWVASSAQHAGLHYGDPAVAGRFHGAARDALVLVQVAVLLPLALLAIVGTMERLAGRALAIFAGVVWILVPLLGYHYFDFRMKPAMLDRFLPEVLGLAQSTAFPAMVALAVGAYLLVRTLGSGSVRWGVATGLAASVALALSPTAILFLGGALATLALRRRWPALGAVAAGAAPGIVAAALWHVHDPHAGAPILHWGWPEFHSNLMGFREYFWSLRVVEWLPIAGTIALLRRSIPLGVGVALWFWLTVLLRGTVSGTFSTADPLHPSTAFLGMLLTAYPAFVLLLAALPFLVPRLQTRLAPAPS
jgi:hypothetical protein